MSSSQAAVAELEKGLGDMQNLKPPGVSGSKINSLTMLCLNNVQVRSAPCLGSTVCTMEAPELTTHPLTVRITAGSEVIYPLQEDTKHSQAGRPIRRRFRNPQMVGEGKGP